MIEDLNSSGTIEISPENFHSIHQPANHPRSLYCWLIAAICLTFKLYDENCQIIDSRLFANEHINYQLYE